MSKETELKLLELLEASIDTTNTIVTDKDLELYNYWMSEVLND